MSGSYPILAYSSNGSKSLESGSWTNGHCVTVTGKVNGTCLNKTPNGDLLVKSNGTVLHSDCKQKRKGKKANKVNKSELRGLISAPAELGEAQSVKSVEDESQNVDKLFNATEYTLGTNRMAKMWESVLTRTNQTQPEPFPQTNTLNVISRNVINYTVSSATIEQPSESTEPTTIGTVHISQPRLEAMTYQGQMCSLNEAISTLKRGEKPLKVGRNSQTRSVSIGRSAIVKPLGQPIPCITQRSPEPLVIQPTVNRSHSQRFGLSPRDISNPCLQNTTYTEALADLATIRRQRAQNQPHRSIQNNAPDKSKLTVRRPF